MSRLENRREKALDDLRECGVVMHDGHYDYGNGIYVDVQAWHNLGWTNEQLVAFAEGVTVTRDAQAQDESC